MREIFIKNIEQRLPALSDHVKTLNMVSNAVDEIFTYKSLFQQIFCQINFRKCLFGQLSKKQRRTINEDIHMFTLLFKT